MNKATIKEIEERLLHIKAGDPFLEELKEDSRKGVQQLLVRWQRQKEKVKQAEDKFFQMTFYENKIRAQGFKAIAGIDEVGRGPLAGPVVAAAVILPENFTLLGIDDSKKLTEAKREEFFLYIKEHAISIGIGFVDAEEIDEINIYEATKRAMLAAVDYLKVKPDFLLIDAVPLHTPYPSESIIKGDANSISIAAASIVAKVTRDRLMKDMDLKYPYYQFAKNMGYGTKEHLNALEEYGPCPYHRKSFEPIKSLMK